MRRIGAVAHNKQKGRQWAKKHWRAQRSRVITIKVPVRRGEYKGEAAFEADACLIPDKLKGRATYISAKRCNYGHGKTPTAAIKNALLGLTRKLK
jgi:hypothetical protein